MNGSILKHLAPVNPELHRQLPSDWQTPLLLHLVASSQTGARDKKQS